MRIKQIKRKQDVADAINNNIARLDANWSNKTITDEPQRNEIVNEYMPQINTRLNTVDKAITCRWCNTAFLISQARNDHCPFCWHLI